MVAMVDAWSVGGGRLDPPLQSCGMVSLLVIDFAILTKRYQRFLASEIPCLSFLCEGEHY
jgi:hypothetical protein